MKTFLAAFGAIVVATTCVMTACNSDDNAGPGTTVLANVQAGGSCTETANCAENLQCGFKIADACPADGGIPQGTCVAFGTCTVHTFCPCGGGAAFDECSDGVNASLPVTGTLSCVVDAGSDGGAEGGADGGSDSATDASADAATDAKPDAALDAAPDAPVVTSDASEDAADAALD